MMMTVFFRDGSSTRLHVSYASVVYSDRRVVKAVTDRGEILFDRSGKA